MVAKWDKFEAHILNQGLSEKRIKKLRCMFSIVTKYLDLDKATKEHIEKFVNDLHKGIITKKDGKAYSGTTKSDLKKFLKQYFKWSKGEGQYFPPEVAWIKGAVAKHEKPKEKPIIELKEVHKVAACFHKLDYRIAIFLLFDSGFRIQELQSVKKRDLTWEEFRPGKKCWWIKCNKSKTFPRKVPVPLFTEEINAFINSHEYESKNKDDALLDISYRSFNYRMKEHSLKVLNVALTPHCFRHSSATFYAREYEGNVPMLAQRFGWSFDAAELKVYVRTSGAYNKLGAQKVYSNQLEELKEDNREIRKELEAQKKETAQLKADVKAWIRKMKG